MLDRVSEGANYDAQQIKILTEALNEALLIHAIPDRRDERALRLAKCIIGIFEAGERDPIRIALLATGASKLDRTFTCRHAEPSFYKIL